MPNPSPQLPIGTIKYFKYDTSYEIDGVIIIKETK
jgi:hypothetical protein